MLSDFAANLASQIQDKEDKRKTVVIRGRPLAWAFKLHVLCQIQDSILSSWLAVTYLKAKQLPENSVSKRSGLLMQNDELKFLVWFLG